MEIQRCCNPDTILVNESVLTSAEEKFNFAEETTDVDYKGEKIKCYTLLKHE